MAKYTKHNSNYIRSGKHQTLKDSSTIFERDWVTIGSQLNFGPGKIPYYNDGNFLFTRSVLPKYQKRHRNGTVVSTWTYEDVKYAAALANDIQTDEYTEDIRSFAYYGSCLELVRASVEHIISTFPGSITLSDAELDVPENGGYTKIGGKIVSNPFMIDLTTKNVTIGKYDNPLRYLSYSWHDYLVNGDEITSYSISDWDTKECLYDEQYYVSQEPVITVTINGTIALKGYRYESDVVFCYEGEELEIRPKDEIIEEYFNNLKGFEKHLLNRKTEPLYKSVFITPIEDESGFVRYKRTYIWPSNGYCIDITSTSYIEFINQISEMARIYDEIDTDNLWRKMTHEAIRNYDWTYTREYEEGEEEDNVEGGERMHKVLNVIGRVFDDTKLSIDTIKQFNKVTYDGDRNMPNALLSDKLDLMGWDVTTIVPPSEDASCGRSVITEQFLNSKGLSWYPTERSDEKTFDNVDVDFMRKMILSSRRILSSKGTVNSIDMVMAMFGYCGDEFYELTEEYMSVTPRRYDESVEGLDMNLGDSIVHLNYSKENEALYADDTSGIPVGSFIRHERGEDDGELVPVTYLIPFYNPNKAYDGNLYFQSNGGWMSDGSENTGFNWNETLSYLRVTSGIEGLLSVNPNSVKNGDIYYVVNINDITKYTEFDYGYYSNFFVLENEYSPDLFSSWTMLDMSGNSYEDMTDDDEKRKYQDYVKKTKYLDSIMTVVTGNNPHVGYGDYDFGSEFFEYMRKPFKYAIDSGNLSGQLGEDAEKIEFTLHGPFDEDANVGKVKNLVQNETADTYYLNSKVVHFRNKVNNDLYKKYLREVIMKYVMQVIPSTTILILENFN